MKIRKLLILILVIGILTTFSAKFSFAGPSGSTYEIKDYSFGAGGTSESGTSGSTYTIFGTAGEVEYGKLIGTTYGVGTGLSFTLKANVPASPSFTNPGTNYDRLKIVIDNGGNAADATFAVAISTDNFAADTRYVKSDFTVGATQGASDFLTYSAWGSTTGQWITGLHSGTTYYVKVKARQGNFTESEYSLTANATTSSPSLTFGISSTNLNFNSLNSGNSYTDSTQNTTLTTSTNAYNGYIVYARETQPLTSPDSTIADYVSPNSAPTTWSGTGFGYTTNDNSLTGGTTDRFTNGGPKYAGFTTTAPGDPVADHPGPILSPLINDQFNIGYRITVDNTKPAGQYTTTLLYIVVPNY
jgi:hypothetical protein